MVSFEVVVVAAAAAARVTVTSLDSEEYGWVKVGAEVDFVEVQLPSFPFAQTAALPPRAEFYLFYFGIPV